MAPSAPPAAGGPAPPAPKRAAATKAGDTNILQNIAFGGMAGVIGQSSVFPLYTVKTNLHIYPGAYRNMVDCFRQLVSRGGFSSLYRGLAPALLGVFPEKAIKLSMNDYLTAKLARPDGSISVPMAMVAGAGAGLSQVVATNPMELVMINMQSNASQGRPKGMLQLVRDLGVAGLYRGTPATLLRDIPFSMVFFSMNTYLRTAFTDDDGNLPLSRTFAAGIAAGSSAAAFSTPMDVIKTRLQAGASNAAKAAAASGSNNTAPSQPPAGSTPTMPQPSSSSSSSSTPAPSSSRGIHTRSFSSAASSAPATNYTGIAHCARDIYAKEGLGGFMAGVGPRVCTIAPLFGITLLFYDIQRRLKEAGRL